MFSVAAFPLQLSILPVGSQSTHSSLQGLLRPRDKPPAPHLIATREAQGNEGLQVEFGEGGLCPNTCTELFSQLLKLG